MPSNSIGRAGSESFKNFVKFFWHGKICAIAEHSGSMSHISGFLFRRSEEAAHKPEVAMPSSRDLSCLPKCFAVERDALYASSICPCCHPSELSTVPQHPAETPLEDLEFLGIERCYRLRAGPVNKKVLFFAKKHIVNFHTGNLLTAGW
jgi:hypothetical protein